jgi:hypothetical protein
MGYELPRDACECQQANTKITKIRASWDTNYHDGSWDENESVRSSSASRDIADPTDLEGILYDVHNRLIGLRRYDLLRALAKPYYLKGIGTYLSWDPCNPTQLHTSLLALRNGGKTMRHG